MRNGFMPGEWGQALPPEYGPMMQDTSRQMKIADLLRQQSLDMPQGQMVSGHYVAPSITQYMAQALKGYNANKMEDDAYAKQKGAWEEYQGKQTAANQALIEGLRGKSVEQPVDYADAGGMPGMTQTVTQPADPEAAMLEYIAAGGNNPALIALAQGKQQRGYQLEDRNYADNREERIYSRNRADQVTDKADDREFQRIMAKEQQGFQLTMQEKNFAQQFQMQKQGQDFQRSERVANQGFTAGENAKSRAATKAASGVDWKYDSGSDTWVAPPDANNPNGRRLPNQEKAKAAQSLEYVAKQFDDQLGKTQQGGFMGISGRAGAVTDYQNQQRFNNLREQLSTEIRTLFRIPGEGALSDKEQAQYGLQLPDVKNDPAINRQILEDIRKRVGIRQGQQQIIPQGEKMPTGNSQPTVVDW